MDLLIATGTFGVIFVILLVVLTSGKNDADQNREIVRRLTRPSDDLDTDITRRKRPQEGQLLGVLYRLDLFRRIEENMWQAGMYMRVGDILLIMVLLFGAGLLLGQALFADVLFGFGGGVILSTVPIFYIQFRKKRRLKAFGQQLPFSLDLVKSSLEAGHSLQRALQVVVGEFADPLGSEFRTVLEQTRIGLPLPRALEEMLKRVPEDDLRLLVVAIKVQSEVGSSLAQIIGRLGEIVRLRQRLRLQIRALTAQARMGGWVVGILPLVVLGAFSLIQPDYTRQLFYDPTGQKILKLAVGLDMAALLTIRRLLRVDY
jgi:tight adherence protein B